MSQRHSEARLAVARPLYSQVRDLLLERTRNSEWSIGQALPNEFNLAAEFGVSIGTVRRAVEGLEETGIVVRKQGRGTYIAGPASTAMLGRFMPLRATNGEPSHSPTGSFACCAATPSNSSGTASVCTRPRR